MNSATEHSRGENRCETSQNGAKRRLRKELVGNSDSSRPAPGHSLEPVSFRQKIPSENHLLLFHLRTRTVAIPHPNSKLRTPLPKHGQRGFPRKYHSPRDLSVRGRIQSHSVTDPSPFRNVTAGAYGSVGANEKTRYFGRKNPAAPELFVTRVGARPSRIVAHLPERP